MMKVIFVCLALLFAGFFAGKKAQAQVENPVHWNFSAKKINSTAYEIHLVADIDKGWHIYSQTTPEGGPLPTVISFNKNPLVQMKGSLQEIGILQKHMEPLFGVEVKQYSGKVDFVQRIELKSIVKTSVSGTIEFMSCDDERCLPPKSLPFKISL